LHVEIFLSFHNSSSFCLNILCNVSKWQGHSVTQPLFFFSFFQKRRNIELALKTIEWTN
jgi:hypothetical protein